MNLKNTIQTLRPAEKLFLKTIFALCAGALTLLLVLSPGLKKSKEPQMYPAGPAGEQAFFKLRPTIAAKQPDAIFFVDLILETCGGSVCAAVSAVEVEIEFDPGKLQLVDADGNPTSSVQTASIFENYFKKELKDGKTIYIAAFNIPPKTYNSSATEESKKVFASFYFKALADNGQTIASIKKSTIYLADSTDDISNQNLAPSKGSLTVNFGQPSPTSLPSPIPNYPAVMYFQTPSTPLIVGSKIPVSIKINTNGASAIGTDALIRFDNNFLQVSDSDITPTNMFQSFPLKEVLRDEIRISGYSLNKPFSGDGSFAAIKFTALKPGTTNIEILFNGRGVTTDSNVSAFSAGKVAEGQEQDLLGSVQNLTLNILQPGSSPNPSLGPGESPEPGESPNPSPSPTTLPLSCHYNADLNNDGKVDSTDLSILILNWGKQLSPGCLITDMGKEIPNPDLNGDGTVNSADIQIFVPWYNP